ncbi:MAG: S41 family peptidase [Actinomycetales bacterium]|nr:MAG: S41 family peptidase [Actinomycetales bacterium]
MLSPWQSIIARFRSAGFNATVAIISLAIILAFVFGDYVGQARKVSPVEQSISKILTKNPTPLKRSVLERAAIEAALKASGDQWANYFPQESVKNLTQTLEGRYSGIGIWLRKSKSGVLEVSSVQSNSPSARAGIKVLDSLIDINGVAMDGASLATAVAALRGAPNTKLQIGVERNQEQIRFEITRESIFNGDVVAYQLATKVIYIQISSITSQVASEIAVALKKYPHQGGVVLDLRDNPGGLLYVAVDVASLFLNGGTIVSYTRKNDSTLVLESNNSVADIAPMTVLINRSTASSAEVIAGALQDRNRAVIIGEKSYGKGTIQEFIELVDGSKLEITVGKYRTPNGRVIDQVGIAPDLLVPEGGEIKKALLVLGGLATIAK